MPVCLWCPWLGVFVGCLSHFHQGLRNILSVSFCLTFWVESIVVKFSLRWLLCNEINLGSSIGWLYKIDEVCPVVLFVCLNHLGSA